MIITFSSLNKHVEKQMTVPAKVLFLSHSSKLYLQFSFKSNRSALKYSVALIIAYGDQIYVKRSQIINIYHVGRAD
jgi:hypothetical protein